LHNCEFKYKELLRKKEKIIEELDGNISNGIHLLDIFKDFCNSCFSLKEWCLLNNTDIKASVHIDICRGVINGDKHVKITRDMSSYNSNYYRINVSGDVNVIQSSTGGYVGDKSHPLYTDPSSDKLVVETENGTFSIRDIVIKSVKEWEYDQNTQEVIDYLKGKYNGNPVSLKTNWIFHASFYFYFDAGKILWIDLQPYDYNLDINTPSEYYYIFTDDYKFLEPRFEVVYKFSPDRWLLEQKKN